MVNKLVEEIIKPILEANSKITKVVGIYGGRFQPFGPHHYKTYKWLTKQVDDAYITTSNIKKPPRHPMNFKEKVRHMSKMGVPSNRIIEEKSPYVAKNLAKKYDENTTAFVYVFGTKDAGRLSSGKYFQDYKKNKNNLNGYEENGYVLTAPHVSISVGGKEVSGTSMRELLGSSEIDDSERAKLFKDMFGYYDKGVFNMITNKFKKLFGEAKGDVWDKENNPNFAGDNIKFDFFPEPEGENDILMDLSESKKEFVIWGIAPGKSSEEILYTKAKSQGEAKKIVKILMSKHGIKKARIQILDLEQDPSKFWKSSDVFEGSLPTKVKHFKKIKKVKSEPDSAKGTYNSTDTFSKHHAGSMGAGDMGTISEPDTYDWDDSGSEPNDGGHQKKKDKKKKGYEPVRENVSSGQLSQVEKYLDRLWGKVGIDVEFTRHFIDRVNDTRNEKPINSAEVMRIFKQTFKKYGKQIPNLGKDAEALMKDMKTDVNVPFVLKWDGKEFDLIAKTIMRKKNFKSSSKKFAVEGKLKEDITIDLDVGDTVVMGKFKNKKVVVKDISWNEKGDMLINGKMATKWRMFKKKPNIPDSPFDENTMLEFLTTIDMSKIINEISSGGGSAMTDDGPSAMMYGKGGYFGRNKEWAEKLGWEVVNYILDVDVKNVPPFKGELGGGKSVSYLPAGIGTGGTPNNPENLTGVKGYNKWVKNMKKIAQNVGFELMNFMDKEQKETKKQISKDTKATLKLQKSDEKEQAKDVKNIKVEESVFSKEWWKENLLTEGGAYGHMAHPFDDKDLTFGDLKKIIEDGLGGTLNREDNVTEKLDGQNIMISWKDGKLIAARNKGHIKNGGKTALTKSGIKSKFKGRGEIANAFNFAMNDLEKAIKGLSDKQKEKIFNNGYNFMNMEVMWPSSANVIDYDVANLVFHGALIYDDSGAVKGEVKGSARILAGMIQQVNKHIGKKYSIGKPNFLTVPKNQDFGKHKGNFIGKLNKLKDQYALKDSDTLGLYHQSYWEEYIFNAAQQFGYEITDDILENLTKRWAFFDKSYKIATIKKDLKEESEFLAWVLSTDKDDHSKMVKENMKPFEVLFFAVGAEILKNVKGFMAVNPDKAVQSIKKKIDKAISDVKGSKDLKKLNTLKLQLDKLNAIGGTNAIVPSEGIVFKYKGNTYKFTGAFAPVNQITGLISF